MSGFRGGGRAIADLADRARTTVASLGRGLGRRARSAWAAVRSLARRLGRAARAGWATARPRSRRGAAAMVALMAVSAVALFVGAAAASSLVSQYGFNPEANQAVWRGLTPAFGDIGQCAGCHTLEYGRLTAATHAGIGCESCHGPLARHALASPGTREAEVKVAVPTDGVCVKCHVAATGRPTGFRQVVPADHYVSDCLQCHDPHTGLSSRPPVVEHTLDRLPSCVTCHGPEGFKTRNQRHPTTATEDKVCLACHLAGRGPVDDPSKP